MPFNYKHRAKVTGYYHNCGFHILVHANPWSLEGELAAPTREFLDLFNKHYQTQYDLQGIQELFRKYRHPIAREVIFGQIFRQQLCQILLRDDGYKSGQKASFEAALDTYCRTGEVDASAQTLYDANKTFFGECRSVYQQEASAQHGVQIDSGKLLAEKIRLGWAQCYQNYLDYLRDQKSLIANDELSKIFELYQVQLNIYRKRALTIHSVERRAGQEVGLVGFHNEIVANPGLKAGDNLLVRRNGNHNETLSHSGSQTIVDVLTSIFRPLAFVIQLIWTIGKFFISLVYSPANQRNVDQHNAVQRNANEDFQSYTVKEVQRQQNCDLAVLWLQEPVLQHEAIHLQNANVIAINANPWVIGKRGSRTQINAVSDGLHWEYQESREALANEHNQLHDMSGDNIFQSLRQTASDLAGDEERATMHQSALETLKGMIQRDCKELSDGRSIVLDRPSATFRPSLSSGAVQSKSDITPVDASALSLSPTQPLREAPQAFS